MMKISFELPKLTKKGVVLALVEEANVLTAQLKAIDKAGDGQLSRAIKAAKFEGKKEQSLDILVPGGALDRLILMGLGKVANLSSREVELLGGAAAGSLQTVKAETATIDATVLADGSAVASLASGAMLRRYSFNAYKTKKDMKGSGPTALAIQTKYAAAAKKAFVPLAAVAAGNHVARDLVNEPSNVLVPVEFAARAKALSKLGVKIEIFTPAQMKKLGMHMLLGVAQGSMHEARMVVMRWDGGKRGEKPVAFIGKGVTFDTGGISIKPAAGMEDMKGDMAGAACVVGLMHALAARKAKANVIGAIGLVENAVDGKAQRPGDIVKSMSGQTVAVLNTDAEGRLVLGDVLWYIQSRFKPQFMVNLATLTGAILVALGKEHAGLFSNNDELSTRIAEAGLATGEKVWRLPLTPEYDKLIDHDVADMKNIGGRFAGSITAAQFLQRFVNNTPWAHLDIAGTGMDSVKSPINQSWASGWGVRLLNHMVATHYEK
jgi:leucyl aminopeptidase